MSVPLPPLSWPKTPEEVKVKTEEILRQTKEVYDRIAALSPQERTYETVIKPLTVPPNYKTNPAVAEAKFLQHCSTDAALREACKDAGATLSKARVSFRLRRDVATVVSAFAESEAANSLSPEQQHFVRALVRDFRLASHPESQKLEGLLGKDTDLCTQYKANIANDKTQLEFDVSELEGLPEDFIKARKTPEGKVAIKLTYPDTVPIVSHCQIAETRKKVALARDGAYHANLELITAAVPIRQEIANLLGFAHYGDYITSNRMTGSAKTAIDFLAGLQEKLTPAGKENLTTLLELKKQHLTERGESFDGELHAWDMTFYHELLLKRNYGVDENVVMQYFPLHVVVEQTLQIYQELLGLTFTEATTGFEKWHPDVRLFAAVDTASGSLAGHFYLDLHPREGKYNHAAIFHLVKKTHAHGSVACMLANLPAPEEGKPALLRHDDVVTFFHEFGHIMHDICAETEGNMTRLAKAPRDFVEAPSQMLENWCWQPEVLARLSTHVNTGEPLPEELRKKLVAAKHVNTPLFMLRQVYMATLDMVIHTEAPSDLQKLVDELRPKISLIKNPPGCNFLRSFGHIMNQYAAAYHGYAWSEVLSADMFYTRFAPEGIFNAKTGMEYRKKVLAVGGIGNIMEHVTGFLGRPPQQDHFLRSLFE